MEKMLIRCGISPLDNFNPSKMIVRNSIGSNIGNLAYQFSIFRTVLKEDVSLVPDRYGGDRGYITSYNSKKINNNYSAYICPMANAFRSNFITKLNKLTELFKELDIPVIIPGIGLNGSLENDGYENFSFDQDVVNFVDSVIENGNIMGVRGNITRNYLSNLGFKENRDFMVIGCPSMFTFGSHLKIKDVKIDENSKIALNSGPFGSLIENIISRTMNEFPNYYFIPQLITELKLCYLGKPSLKINNHNYPRSMESNSYKNNRVKVPISAYTWIKFLKTVDLSFGARLHGNIMATIAGTPSIMILKDARMKEIAEYHDLTRIYEHELNDLNSINDIIDNIDFKSPEKNHKKLFKNYLKFWKKNNIETVFDKNINVKKVPIDNFIEKVHTKPPIETISNLEKSKIHNRIKEYNVEKKIWKSERTQLKKKNEFEHIKSMKIGKNKISKLISFYKKYNF
jgi:polysaccharide pyruvyl transferase